MKERPRTTPAGRTFERCFASVLASETLTPPGRMESECRNSAHRQCTICHAPILSYDDETRLKQSAFLEFWKSIAPSCIPDPLVPSPQGRRYRMVTKRKVFVGGHTVTLALIDPVHRRPFAPLVCAIEPPTHAPVYEHLQRSINAPWAEPLANELQYVIVRGNEREHTVIFNVRALTQDMIQPANRLSKSLTRACPAVVSVFLFEGGTEDAYYLGGTDPVTPRRVRKLYGSPEIFQSVDGRTMFYSPFSFSQVNHAILSPLIGKVKEYLGVAPARQLFDLYCGYGLFSLTLAGHFSRVTGIELSHASIDSAVANAHRLKAQHVRFVRSAIDAGSIERLTASLSPACAVILDPPRGGTGPEVLERIAGRRPGTVLHLFCNAGIIPDELSRWTSNGYEVCRAVPIDMFPGTSDIETLVLLKPNYGFREGPLHET